MYAIGQRVYVRAHDCTGTISERNFIGQPRRACYVVDLGDGHDYMTGSAGLQVADWCCDTCDRWRPASDAGNGPRDIDGYMLVRCCWFCVNVLYKEH